MAANSASWNASALNAAGRAGESWENAYRLPSPVVTIAVDGEVGQDRAVLHASCACHLDDVACSHRDAGIERGEEHRQPAQALVERVEQLVVGRPEV